MNVFMHNVRDRKGEVQALTRSCTNHPIEKSLYGINTMLHSLMTMVLSQVTRNLSDRTEDFRGLPQRVTEHVESFIWIGRHKTGDFTELIKIFVDIIFIQRVSGRSSHGPTTQ